MRGTPYQRRQATPHRLDHPRACGELVPLSSASTRTTGSSPRMRGTRGHRGIALRHDRIIPAHAGNSSWSVTAPENLSDHPRACGELANTATVRALTTGSSPRMRGTPGVWQRPTVPRRIIPAHAGNSIQSRRRSRRSSDHPRACGELVSPHTQHCLSSGSSPRMRGTLVDLWDLAQNNRIIPAHAGNSVTDLGDQRGQTDHPRACGELDLYAT